MARHETRATLHKLSDTDLRLAGAAEDIRGRRVLDRDGEAIGEVDDLLVDDEETKVRFLQVASGGFLGLGQTKFLIPVDAITSVTEEAVYVDQTRERIAGAPPYDPDLVGQTFLDHLYRHYGYPPYWGQGHAYPPYPRSPRDRV